MFNFQVLVKSNPSNFQLLRRLKLVNGRDFQSVKGAASQGRPEDLCLMFKDRDVALQFKLRCQ
jgi:hypothetical protein